MKFKRIFVDENLTVVYHGIDVETFNPKYVNRRLKKRLKAENDFIVTSTSLLIPVKKVDYAISAFNKFLRISKAKNAILLIIGEGPMRNQLEKMVLDLGIEDKVRFLGKVEHVNIRDYLSISDVVIATSSHSNVNRSTLEAMACAKPILAFDSGNTRQVFTHMSNCLLAENGNVEEFAEGLLMLYTNSRLRNLLGERGRRFVTENRSWENRIEKELTVFRKLVPEGAQDASSERNK
jgi:glycosyltransferase involved in cell wall biosynthesis